MDGSLVPIYNVPENGDPLPPGCPSGGLQEIIYGSGLPSGTPETNPALYIDISNVDSNGGATLWGWNSDTGSWYPFKDNWAVKTFGDNAIITDNLSISILVVDAARYINGSTINSGVIN